MVAFGPAGFIDAGRREQVVFCGDFHGRAVLLEVRHELDPDIAIETGRTNPCRTKRRFDDRMTKSGSWDASRRFSRWCSGGWKAHAEEETDSTSWAAQRPKARGLPGHGYYDVTKVPTPTKVPRRLQGSQWSRRISKNEVLSWNRFIRAA
jgi:hypothetical protein